MATADLISAAEAARRYEVNPRTLVAAYRAGRVRGREIRRRGLGRHGIGYLFRADELDHDLAGLPRCLYPGCSEQALGPSGGCPRHAGPVSLMGRKFPERGPRISAAKMGHTVSPETRDKIASSLRKYPPEQRRCLWCEKDLGLVPGWKIRAHDGRGGNFCDDRSHPTLWMWTNERFPRGPGPSELTCQICRHRTVTRWPSQVVAAGGNLKARFICSTCLPIWRHDVMAARMLFRHLRRPYTATQLHDAFRRALPVAVDFDEKIRKLASDKPGRRPPHAVDLLIEAGYREGLTDRRVCDLLNESLRDGTLRVPGVRSIIFDMRYVTKRRERARIWRGARGDQLRQNGVLT